MSSSPEQAGHRGAERGDTSRVVMVLTNFVTGDSRAQKIARSAAAAGWDVTLIGRAKSSRREESRLGDARVIKVPARMTGQTYRRTHPPRGLLGWLGYRSADLSRMRCEEQRARRHDLQVELWRARELGANPFHRMRLAWLRARLRWRGYLVEGRRRLYERSARRFQRRKIAPSAWDRIKTRTVCALSHDKGAWRYQPELTDFEIAFGPEIDKARPDIIHAHDVDALGLAVRAAARARKAGRTVKVVYDAHEYVAGVVRADPSWSPVMTHQEAKYISLADAVITVCHPLAEILRDRYRLSELPAVVANMPERDRPDEEPVSDVRTVLGLDPRVPILVYPGVVTPLRGLTTVVEALPRLPGVHFAVLVGERHRYVVALEERAAELGVADRLHILPYVKPHQVVDFIRTATVGIIPLLPTPAHQIAICTKYYEFMHAGLPVVVSDMRGQADLTRELGNGEVYPAGDATGCANAVRAVLADRDRYTKVYDAELLERFSWEHQVPTLLGVYTRISAAKAMRQASRRVGIAENHGS
ncbi:glycosyltransferase family 4 protein [Carbonactinospora thermoautotrophica]|uniref:glycosyltransferase family 4 protein n=1 Tax=Carbonactinospora thermoautotrophica TaxID=1469144 RepID=UPI00082F04EB|nr:glycosyltransferase family 4 protein [Carbonactinospora thermoautotrophica]